jgi:hypothetical protein
MCFALNIRTTNNYSSYITVITPAIHANNKHIHIIVTLAAYMALVHAYPNHTPPRGILETFTP